MKQEWVQGTQFTTWQNKGNYRPEELRSVDWSKEYWAISHPVRVIAKGQDLVNYDTGEVLATLKEGYSWFWAHDHPHVCRSDWDGRSYPDGWPEERIGE